MFQCKTMNENTSKKIFFNKSSLIGLKAELLKKQEEVQDKKQLPQHKVENYKRPPAKSKDRPDKEPTKSFKDNLKAVDTEELDACRNAKAALEKKAELYEHLADAAGSSQLASRFLVDFNAKRQQEASQRVPSPEHEPDSCTDQVDDDDDEQWVEFTDCLGRSRKCLKSDLHLYKEKDQELSREVEEIVEKTATKQQDGNVPPVKEKPLLVQKTNDFLQTMREKWEQKERELLAKDKDIHYQDILFDEARQHGVGYYSFSTDETERRQQMAELVRRREETLRAQREAEEGRRRRDELVAARVNAARARQRARAGLPPEEPQANTKDFTTHLLEFLNKQKDEADAEAKEKERIIKEEKEKERQKLREAYVREWDMGKEGVEGKAKKFVEMTQEEYVEQQRSKRIEEFAPRDTPSASQARYVFDDKGRKVSPDAAKTWADVRPLPQCPAPPIISDSDMIEQKGLYFTSSTKTTSVDKAPKPKYSNFVRPQAKHTSREENFIKNEPTESNIPSTTSVGRNNSSTNKVVGNQSMKYKNFVEYQEPATDPVWIVNEVSDNSEEETIEECRGSTEVAPPPTYDYYGPVPKKQKTQQPFSSDIHEAFAQGSKTLETKSTGRQLSHQYDFSLE